MSKTVKFIYFIVAVLSMAGLAGASIAMAENKSTLSVVLFVVTFAVIAVAFIVKAKMRARSGPSTPRKQEA